ncbi:MAG TPA: VCBS domain-containing protein, partial [Vicinamibacterales bacterium]
FDFLAHGETLTLIYDVTVTDNNGLSSTKQVTVQIGASNDQPVISVVENAAVKEDVGAVYDILKDTGSVTFTDTDLTDTHKAYVAYNHDAAGSAGVPLVLANALATALTVPASALAAGSHTFNWDFALDTNLVQYLAEGETITATYTITVADNSNGTNDTSVGQVVTVVITGTNDAPNIAVTNPVADTEGNAGTPDPVSVAVVDHVSITDVDTSDVHVLYVADTLSFDAADSSGPVPVGSVLADLFILNATDGTISYDRAAFDYLAAGEQVTATFTFDASSGPDTLPKSITVTIDGANDAPVVSGAALATVTEDGATSTLDALANASDVDNGHTLSVVNLPNTLPAGVTYDAVHHTFTFDPADPAYQSLGYGQSAVVTVDYGVSDGIATTPTAASVSWTINGTNDAPVLNGDNVATLELGDGVTKVSGISLTDVDANADTFTVTATADHGTVATAVGNVPLAGAGVSGSFAAISDTFYHGAVYTPDNASPTDKVTLTVTDSHGGSDTLNFIFKQYAPGGVTLTGTADKDIIFSSTGDDTMTGMAGQD